MQIKQILDKDNYKKILTYLEVRNFFLVSELTVEVIQNIDFIPGVSMNTLNSAKDLLLKANKSEKSYRCPKNRDSANYEPKSSHGSVLKNSEIIQNQKSRGKAARIKIVDFLKDIPRAHYFTSYCYSKDIIYVDELHNLMPLEISSIRFIGTKTAKSIEKKFAETLNLDSSSAKTTIKKIDFNSSLYSVFGDMYKANIFIDYCDSREIYKLSDLVGYDVGRMKIPEITNNTKAKFKERLLFCLENINYNFDKISAHHMAKDLPVNLFVEEKLLMNIDISFGCSVSRFIDSLDAYQYTLFSSYIERMTMSPVDYYEEALTNLGQRDYQCLVSRARGFTLQAIADEHKLSRERVRQIVSKASEKLYSPVNIIFHYLSKNQKNAFTQKDLKQLNFSGEYSLLIAIYILKSSRRSKFKILDFSNLIIPTDWFSENHDYTLNNLFDFLISDGITFQDFIEKATHYLEQNDLGFLESEDIENYLINNKYLIFKNFIMPRSSSYAHACINAIVEHFDYDIKLDSDENNNDLARLRSIMSKEYPGLNIGKTNRALSSRLMNFMILSGRGRYIPVSKLRFDKVTIEEIINHIDVSNQNTFYFAEIYELFKQRLIFKSKVDNKYLLQGIIKHFYSDNFVFDRDSLTKLNTNKLTVDSRVISLLLEKKSVLTRQKIMDKIVGLNDSVLTFIIERNSEIINFGDGKVNHINNLNLSENFIKDASDLISKVCDSGGYLSVHVLYNKLEEKYSKLFEKNAIEDSFSLYYVLQLYFSDKYDMSEPPHILKKGTLNKTNSYDIILHYLLDHDMLNKDHIEIFANENKWSIGTTYWIIKSLDDKYLRLNDTEYFIKDITFDNLHIVKEVDSTLASILEGQNFVPTINIIDFDGFPDIGFRWNSFLLESFIVHYSNRFEIIKPLNKDLRYIKSLIARKQNTSKSYEDILIEPLKRKKQTKISEYDFLYYLNTEGLALEQIPKEFYNGKNIKFYNEYFHIT